MTMDRRTFMQTGAVIAGMATPIAGALSAATDAGGVRFECFVFDDRFDEAVAAARQAATQGIVLAGFTGDLTRLWYDELDLRWRAAPMTLAGATTQQGLFVLETLAADRGMRLVHRAEHGRVVARTGRAEETTLLSWIIAPRSAGV